MRRPLLLAAALLAACADAPSEGLEAPPVEAPAAVEGEVTVPADSGALAPRLAVEADGTPLLSWVEPTATGHALRFARWTGAGWSEPATADASDDWFVNWADTPGVVPTAGGLLAHTLPRHPDGDSPYAYDVAIRQGSGGDWGPPALVHDDGVAAEHGFVSAVRLGDGRTGLVWLDGRNQGGGHDGHGAGAMSLRYAAVGLDGSVTDGAVLDARTCDCCPTAAAATASGLVVAYRDRSEAEVRDVAVVRLADGAWTEPVIPHADGWTIEGCPVNGPALASAGDRVALAWFAEPDSARVWLTTSDDGGATWGRRVRIDGGAPIGRVGVALLEDGSAAVSWLESAGAAAEVRVRRVGLDGTAAAPAVVATVDAGRSSGVPHVVALGDRALVAWTDPGASTVRTAVVAP